MLPSPSTFSSYGGEKADYSPVEDPATDRSAAETNAAFADVAAMTRTIARAFCSFTYDGTSCTVVEHDAVWGSGGAPAVERTGAGNYIVDWPATVTDALGEVQNVSLRRGLASVEDVGWQAVVTREGPNRIRVRAYDIHHGTVDDPGSATITVVAW